MRHRVKFEHGGAPSRWSCAGGRCSCLSLDHRWRNHNGAPAIDDSWLLRCDSEPYFWTVLDIWDDPNRSRSLGSFPPRVQVVRYVGRLRQVAWLQACKAWIMQMPIELRWKASGMRVAMQLAQMELMARFRPMVLRHTQHSVCRS